MSGKAAGRGRFSFEGVVYTAPTDEEIVLAAVAARLGEAREILRAVTDDAKVAVIAAADGGMSERSIARALGVHRRTVSNWRANDYGEDGQ